MCGQRIPEPGFRDVVDERAPAVDLDHGQKLAVPRLEGRIPADVDLRQLELDVRAHGVDRRARTVAEMAPLRGVEDDANRYG